MATSLIFPYGSLGIPNDLEYVQPQFLNPVSEELQLGTLPTGVVTKGSFLPHFTCLEIVQ